jgi:hypothetical protein
MNDVTRTTKQQIRQELALIISVCFIAGVTLCFVVSSYLNKGPFEHFISYLGSDGPVGYADSVNPNRLGVHTFGDYLLPRWQSNLSSPWFITDTANGPRNNYLPFTMAVFWLFSAIAYWESFVLFMMIGTIALLSSIWFSMSGEQPVTRGQLIVSSVILTSPFISLMDRGNIQILLTALVVVAFFLYINNQKSWGALALGLAIALKGYPIVFLVVWLRERRWKDCLISLSTAAFTTVLPLLFYDGGILRNLSRIFRNIRLNEEMYAYESLAYNNSLKGSLLSLQNFQMTGISSAAQFGFEHIHSLNLLIVATAGFIMLKKQASLFDVSLMGAVLATTLVDYVAAYALGLYFIAVLTLSHGAEKYSVGKRRLLFLLIGIQMMPKGVPVKFWSETLTGPTTTYASLLGGTVGILILMICATDILQRSTNESENTENLSL